LFLLFTCLDILFGTFFGGTRLDLVDRRQKLVPPSFVSEWLRVNDDVYLFSHDSFSKVSLQQVAVILRSPVLKQHNQ